MGADYRHGHSARNTARQFLKPGECPGTTTPDYLHVLNLSQTTSKSPKRYDLRQQQESGWGFRLSKLRWRICPCRVSFTIRFSICSRKYSKLQAGAGAGKATIIGVLAGSLRSDSGDITIDGNMGDGRSADNVRVHQWSVSWLKSPKWPSAPKRQDIGTKLYDCGDYAQAGMATGSESGL